MTDSRTPSVWPRLQPQPLEAGLLLWNERSFLRDQLLSLLDFHPGFRRQ